MLTITTAADLDALAHLRAFVEQACRADGIAETVCVGLQLALDELYTNIITHGYANQATGSLTVTFAYTAPQIKITIQDQGRPFDPRQAQPPDLTADWAERTIGGLGIYLVQQVVDRLEYSSDPVTGNVLVLFKDWERTP